MPPDPVQSPHVDTPDRGIPGGRGFPRNPAVARALREARQAAAEVYADAVADYDKVRAELTEMGRAAYIARELVCYVDYLSRAFEDGDVTFKHLYIGEKRKQFFIKAPDTDATDAEKARILGREREGLVRVLKNRVSPTDLAVFDEQLADLERILLARPPVTLKVVFYADCLYLDVLGFLTATCLEDGIGLQPILIASRDPAVVVQMLKDLTGVQVDAVIYAPFSYEFAPGYAALLGWRAAVDPRIKSEELLTAAVARADEITRLFAGFFECPIYVHNAAVVARHEDRKRDRIKALVSSRLRRQVRDRLAKETSALVRRINDESFEHVFVVDEAGLVEQHGERALGRFLYHTELQHPAALAREVAALYVDRLFVHAHLLKRKLVVCDLDNTLWRGVIGEGAVQHHADRQHTLKALRQRGVVLSVASKNDPKNVHFRGAVLSEDDFVDSQINWDMKSQSVARTAQVLNLKTKSFVFIDDRADERALVHSAHPELLPLDAEDPRTWRVFSLWAKTLANDGEGDRTAQYQQRAKREAFLQTQEGKFDPTESLMALGLTIRIHPVSDGDERRAVELVNRTNQFNLTGARTTLAELSLWRSEPGRHVLMVEAGDKFGSAGSVCVCCYEHRGDVVTISTFVLSCRVFGYGIETAVLNHIKRTTTSQGRTARIIGQYRETASNQPSTRVYPDNGFVFDGTAWVHEPGDATPLTDPAWLTIQTG